MTRPDDWIALENRFYRRELTYSSLPSLQNIALNTCLAAAAPNAGPIALIPNAGWGVTHSLSIHTLAGEQLHLIERLRERSQLNELPFRAVTLAWSVDDVLNIVYNDGVLLRLPTGADLNRAKLIRVFQNDSVYDVVILSTAEVVIRTESGTIYNVDANDKVRSENFSLRPPEAVTRHALNATLAAIPAYQSTHDVVETLAITENASLVVANSSGVHHVSRSQNVSYIVPSPNGQYVAAFEASTGDIFVCDIALRAEITRLNLVLELSVLGVDNIVSEDLFNAKEPDSISWIGSDAVAVAYKEHLILVGPKKGVAVLKLQEPAVSTGLIVRAEQDGLRLISSGRVEFLQMVAEPVSSVLCQKQAPSYKLLRSSGMSLDNTVTSTTALMRYQMLRELREANAFKEAARDCVSAAYLEVDVDMQKRLLHAAAYGQRHASVFSNSNKHSFTNEDETPVMRKRREDQMRQDVEMLPTAISILRVLNAASSPEAGVPLTKIQFDLLGLPRLVKRLSQYRKHTLALRLASFGGISPYDVLSEWASYVITSKHIETDEELKSLIAEKFDVVSKSFTVVSHHGSRKNKALPYVNAAEAAHAAGRLRCADLLLRLEIRPAPKVDMFLKMKREKPAIMYAVASGDPELVLDVLGVIMENKNVRETAQIIRTLPPSICNRATDLLATHLKQIGSSSLLKALYHEVGRLREAALIDIQMAHLIADPRKRLEELERAVKTVGKGYDRRACQFELQTVQHAAAVSANAINLEKKAKLEVGSLRLANDRELLATAIKHIGDPSKRREALTRLRRELRIPERRFFWICLDALAAAGDFVGIESLSKTGGSRKAPPIGFSAFVDTCIKYRKDEEAVKYALRIADLRNRARALAKCGRGREAADIASRLRNQQLLEEVQDLTAVHVAYLSEPTQRTESGITAR